jgi:hypothetical protein
VYNHGSEVFHDSQRFLVARVIQTGVQPFDLTRAFGRELPVGFGVLFVSLLAATEIQKNTTNSLTLATRSEPDEKHRGLDTRLIRLCRDGSEFGSGSPGRALA